jgi:hypothetical protein
VAFNATLLSYNGSLDIGIHIDSAAVEQPELLRDEIERSLNKLIYAAARPATPAPAATERPKWWSRLFR